MIRLRQDWGRDSLTDAIENKGLMDQLSVVCSTGVVDDLNSQSRRLVRAITSYLLAPNPLIVFTLF